MKLTLVKSLAFSAGLALVITGCAQAEKPAEVSLVSDEEKAAYGIGYGFAANLKQQTAGLELSAEALVKGVADAMADAEMAVSEEDVQAAITVLQQKQMEIQQAQQEAQQAEQLEQAKAARVEGEAFLEENGKREEVVTTESGLQYEVITRGDSDARPTAESTVNVHYHGTLINGTVFDSSVERGEPIEFPLANVIAGWTEGVQLMAVGDKFRFFIPADLAYGDNGAGALIAPGSTLIFEVELLDFI